MKKCEIKGCENFAKNNSCPYCYTHYDQILRTGRISGVDKAPDIRIYTVWEDEKEHPQLAEAVIVKASETCFWIARKNKGFGYRTRIRRDDLWYSFSPGEAVRSYLIEKRRGAELLKRQLDEAEILLEGIEKR